MKPPKIAALCAVALMALCAAESEAAILLTCQSAEMRESGGGAVNAGSLGVLVADISGDGFATPETLVGSSLVDGGYLGASDNLILHVFSAFSIDGYMGFSDTFNVAYADGMQEGVALAIYWFPSIDSEGATISAGTEYGFYTSDLYDPNNGGDIAFVAPADYGAYNLFVFDNATNPASSTTPGELTASLIAVPEPSLGALLALGAGGILGLLSRRLPLARHRRLESVTEKWNLRPEHAGIDR